MAFDDPLIDGLSLSGAELRRADAMMLMSDGTAGGARGGIRPGSPGLAVSVSGVTITVTAGVMACTYPAQGVYRAYNGSAWTGTVTAAHATLQRIDLVYLRVWDNAVDASGLAKADVVYLAGTAGSGSAPTPAGTLIYLPLASITVPAVTPGGSISVTDLRPVTVAPGGIGVGTGIPGVHAGQFRDTGGPTGTIQRYTGSAWENRLRLASGGQVNVGGSGSAATLAVIATASNTDIVATQVTGDTASRYIQRAGGNTEYGPGTSARDVTTGRVGTGLFGMVVGEMAGLATIVIKPANTDLSSTTILTNDPHLTVSLAAGAVYLVEVYLYYAALNSIGFKTGWNASGGITSVNRSCMGPGSNATDTNADNISMRSGVHAYTTQVTYGTRNHATNLSVATETGMVSTTTASTLTIQWAQVSSNLAATRLGIGSWLRATRIS